MALLLARWIRVVPISIKKKWVLQYDVKVWGAPTKDRGRINVRSGIHFVAFHWGVVESIVTALPCSFCGLNNSVLALCTRFSLFSSPSAQQGGGRIQNKIETDKPAAAIHRDQIDLTLTVHQTRTKGTIGMICTVWNNNVYNCAWLPFRPKPG